MLRNSNGTNENRAKFLRDSVNPMSPCDGRGVAGPVSPGEMPPGILGPNPMRGTDSHQSARHSNENRTVVPAEKSRSHYTSEIRRRLHSTSGDSYK
jgi:hypothetical protein